MHALMTDETETIPAVIKKVRRRMELRVKTRTSVRLSGKMILVFPQPVAMTG
ncbi:hypothetical protein [[Pseudopropionibacterium] massiliense]|uniref:hypothetical protein n=1 Tax=[Pseudopropionibacterium] massiliense TaxID=2220000 RepID=UPI0013EEFCC5|nr:hypothetical protein [[Pseudopropionibacterium] massiliense]